MSTKELKVSFNAPLNELDTEVQTYGCRANNPDICANNSITNICAFTSEAVSYTHLDVYKRQDHNRSSFSCENESNRSDDEHSAGEYQRLA